MVAWARERLNVDREELARKVGTKPHIVEAWETAERRPTIKQLRKMARVLERPEGHFYLDEPPPESAARLEMRRVFGGSPVEDTYAFAREVQRIQRRREIALDLFDLLGEEPPELPDPFSLRDDPENVGRVIRADLLRLSVELQVTWRDDYEALRTWRKVLEDSGVLSFQITGVEMSEVRGVAMARRPLPVVAFNAKDSVRGRVFTLLHELGHVLLGESTLHAQSPLAGHDGKERWCNRFAATVLIPEEDLLSVATVREKGSTAFWDEAEVERLANRYRVSPAAMVRRLDRFDRIASGAFGALRQRFDDRRFEPPSSGGEGGGNFYNNQLTRLGSLLPELAFRAFYANQIGARELSAVMGTKVENLSTFEEKVMGSTYAFNDV